MQLSLGPIVGGALVISAITLDRPELFWGVALGVVLTIVAALVLLWSTSAFLHVYAYGVVVGRRFPGSPIRTMWFAEIDPASLRVFDDIDSVRSLPYRSLSSKWHFSGGADLAVTFVGPDRESHFTTHARKPSEGTGYVIFGSQRAEEIAELMRAGFERCGYPPEQAHGTARFGVQRLRGTGRMALYSIPGTTVEPRQ